MRLVVLGLSLSSAWGNGHATTYRALLRALAARGHEVTFLERDVPWYRPHRDLANPSYCRLEFYADLADLARSRALVAAADMVMVGSYVPDGVAVGDWVLRHARGVTAFYDIDTPVTLAGFARGEEPYIATGQVARYDLYLSFTGGPTLDTLRNAHGAPAPAALYCSVDADAYRPVAVPWRWDCSYLGTYSADRQPTLERLLLEPARRAPELRFAVAGAQYPGDIAWPANVERIDHVPPSAHAAFFGASRFTLNVTRARMLEAGYSPSVRLFEAGACGTAVISDRWDGIEALFGPGRIAVADTADAVLALLHGPESVRATLAAGLRHRVLRDHTAAHRAGELEALYRRHARTPATGARMGV